MAHAAAPPPPAARLASPCGDLSGLPRRTIPAGTRLYHGTQTAGRFVLPDGPAWFTTAEDSAARWIGWARAPVGRRRGASRVLVAELTEAVALLDVVALGRWRHLALATAGDPEAGPGTMARVLRSAGIAGWYGRTEVLLTVPEAVLSPVEVRVHAPRAAQLRATRGPRP